MLYILIKAGTILSDFMSLERPFLMVPTFFQVQNLFQIDKIISQKYIDSV